MNYTAYKPKKKEKKYVPPIFKIIFVFSGILLGLILSKIIFFSIKVPDNSMLPNLTPGTMCLGMRFSSPTYGDIVIVENPVQDGTYSIKRVIAIEGDTVEIQNRQIIINGKITNQTYKIKYDDVRIFPSEFSNRDNMPQVKVPKGHFFIVGDNTDFSYDSRTYGPVSKDKIKSRVIFNF